MGALGTLGDLVFEVSSNRVRTYDGATLNSSARWEEHDVIGSKPRLEFIGPGLRQMTLTVRLDAQHGTAPEAEAEALRQAVETGERRPLLIGGVPRGYWVVQEISESWRHIGPNGAAAVIELDLTLKEYPG